MFSRPHFESIDALGLIDYIHKAQFPFGNPVGVTGFEVPFSILEMRAPVDAASTTAPSPFLDDPPFLCHDDSDPLIVVVRETRNSVRNSAIIDR